MRASCQPEIAAIVNKHFDIFSHQPNSVHEYLFELSYPRYRKDLEAIRPGLEDLGLYEIVLEALSQSETLARSGKFDEAEDLILKANRKLTDASGHSDDLRRMYKASTDES